MRPPGVEVEVVAVSATNDVALHSPVAKDSNPRRRPPERAPDAVARYARPSQLLCCKFVLLSAAFNALGSVAGPLPIMYLLFAVVSTGPYEWDSFTVLGIIFFSPFVAAVLCSILAPGMALEMVRKGWYFKVQPTDAQLKYIPFVRWRIGLARYAVIGLVTGFFFYWPVGLLVVRFGTGPTMSTWTHIATAVTYCVLIAPTVTALGLLSFAVAPNFERIEKGMSMHPSPLVRNWRRFKMCLRLLW